MTWIQRWCGDEYIAAFLGDTGDLPTVLRVIQTNQLLLQSDLAPLIVETVPTLCSILIHFDASEVGPREFSLSLDAFLNSQTASRGVTINSRRLTLPVLYGGTVGPDLDFVASVNGMSTSEAVRRIADATHLVAMICFTPGTAACMWLEPELALSTPKYSSPRTYTPEGTIGLGGSSIAIYSVPSAGGFQMVGRMPVPVYCPYPILPAFEKSPTLLVAGDRLIFQSVTRDEYDEIAQRVREGRFEFEVEEGELTVDLESDLAANRSTESP